MLKRPAIPHDARLELRPACWLCFCLLLHACFCSQIRETPGRDVSWRWSRADLESDQQAGFCRDEKIHPHLQFHLPDAKNAKNVKNMQNVKKMKNMQNVKKMKNMQNVKNTKNVKNMQNVKNAKKMKNTKKMKNVKNTMRRERER
ncbi:uncharacterized protein FYW61_019404 isoform 1-T1 [Anableps anableps]